MTSGALTALVGMSSASLFAAGARLIFGSAMPFGRPRCEAMINRAPWSRSQLMVGREALIRVSSRMAPFSSRGTLKSTRRKTRFPLTSRSVTKFMPASLGDELGQVDEPAGVAPLVVVPGDDLGQVAVDDLGREQVDDPRAGVAHEVHRDERLLGDAEDALGRGGRGALERGADVVARPRFLEDGDENHQRD